MSVSVSEMDKRLLLASNNEGKYLEFKSLLSDLKIELVTPAELGINKAITENGQTYTENAVIKASTYAKASNMVCIADDSGLEVDVLDGLPGLHSARFCPKPEATDFDRRVYLLSYLEGMAFPWTARFRCVIALTTPSGIAHFTEGVCPGEIIPSERGSYGFGYDPIFLLPKLGKTMAELSMEEKNRVSHRARATMLVRPFVIDLLT